MYNENELKIYTAMAEGREEAYIGIVDVVSSFRCRKPKERRELFKEMYEEAKLKADHLLEDPNSTEDSTEGEWIRARQGSLAYKAEVYRQLSLI